MTAPSNADLREAIWQAIKGWDLERSHGEGYAGATGTDVQTIIDAIEPVFQAREQQLKAEAEVQLRKDNDFIKALKRDVQQQLLTEILSHAREYEITDLEMLDHHNETPLVAVPVSVIERKIGELNG